MWPEVDIARKEKRRELVLGGPDIAARIHREEGLDKAIFTLTSLNYLSLHECNLTLLPSMAHLVNLQSLVLHSNHLEVLPDEVFQLDKLKLLDVSRNKIRTLPAEVDKLINVVTLNFSNNSIETFPKLEHLTKLSVLDISNNKLFEFPDLCCSELSNLSEVILKLNRIEILPPKIDRLSQLKSLDLSGNQIKTVPGNLTDCHKLKSFDLKNNPITDRRLAKLIDQCRTKQILDYVKLHCPKITCEEITETSPSSEEVNNKNGEVKKSYRFTITVGRAGDETLKITVDESVRPVREYLVACVVKNIKFDEHRYKKFIQKQNKLHEGVCAKRNSATIATHDFDKLGEGNLIYTTLPPQDLKIRALNRTSVLTGAQLFTHLQREAQSLRKEKKRSTYSGIHKYLHLLEGQSRFPCILNATTQTVISFPPITNSEDTKIHLDTKNMLIEVTGSVSLHLCKTALEALVLEMLDVFGECLELVQVKCVDADGNLRVVYPSKTDLNYEDDDIQVVRL